MGQPFDTLGLKPLLDERSENDTILSAIIKHLGRGHIWKEKSDPWDIYEQLRQNAKDWALENAAQMQAMGFGDFAEVLFVLNKAITQSDKPMIVYTKDWFKGKRFLIPYLWIPKSYENKRFLAGAASMVGNKIIIRGKRGASVSVFAMMRGNKLVKIDVPEGEIKVENSVHRFIDTVVDTTKTMLGSSSKTRHIPVAKVNDIAKITTDDDGVFEANSKKFGVHQGAKVIVGKLAVNSKILETTPGINTTTTSDTSSGGTGPWREKRKVHRPVHTAIPAVYTCHTRY